METDMTDNPSKEELKAAKQRADRERRLRLALIDNITKALNEDHDTVEGLKGAINEALGGKP